jgi:hypothetical protein
LQCHRHGFDQQLHIFCGAGAYPNTAVLRRNKGHSYEQALLYERRQDPLGKSAVLLAIYGNKIGRRGQGGQAVFAGDIVN